MKKREQFFFRKMGWLVVCFLAVATFSMTACSDSDDDSEGPSITFEGGNTYTIPAGATEVSVKVTSNVEWTLVSAPDWLDVVAPEQTMGTQNLQIKVLNSSVDERNGNIELSAVAPNSLKATLKVIDPGVSKNSISWDLTILNYISDESSRDIKVTADVEYKFIALNVENNVTVNFVADWISFQKKAGETDVWTMTVHKNTRESRKAEIFVVPASCEETLDAVSDYTGKVIEQDEAAYAYFTYEGKEITELDVSTPTPISLMYKFPLVSNFMENIENLRFVKIENEGTLQEEVTELGTRWENFNSRLTEENGQKMVNVIVPDWGDNYKDGVLIGEAKEPRSVWVAVDVVVAEKVNTYFLKLSQTPQRFDAL